MMFFNDMGPSFLRQSHLLYRELGNIFITPSYTVMHAV